MLQANLIFEIQKKIKQGSIGTNKAGSLEESTVVVEDTPVDSNKAETVLESSFLAGIHHQTEKLKKKEEHKAGLITESFRLHKAERKLQKDINYFNYLYENFVDDVFKEQYLSLMESVFNDTINLYKECDVTPRLISPALDSQELSEAQVVDLYKNALNKTVKDEYTKPILSGKISELYESELTALTVKLIHEGSDVDMEQVRVYMPFEETIYQFNKHVLIPEIANSRIESFMESMTDDYLEFVEESAMDMLKTLEKKIKLMTSMVSPNMFEKAVDADGIDAPKMAGITIAVDKNFDDDEPCVDDICPAEVAASDAEAAEEMADEDEAQEIDADEEDIPEQEEAVRSEMDLDTDTEDLEDTAEQEEDAEESATEETAEHPDQPGAVELTTNDTTDPTNPTNTSDVDLQGEGNDLGTDDAAGATLPGDVPDVAPLDQGDIDDFGLGNQDDGIDNDGIDDAIIADEEDSSENEEVNSDDEDIEADAPKAEDVSEDGDKD